MLSHNDVINYVLGSALMAPESRSPPPGAEPSIKHVTCPECSNEKGVVAATHFGVMMCFCPACEHTWDCDTADA